MEHDEDCTRFGVVQTDEDGRITRFQEKPLVVASNLISTGVYVIRRRQLIEMIEKAMEEDRTDFVKDVLVRYIDLKRIYSYEMTDYWISAITSSSSIRIFIPRSMTFRRRNTIRARW